MPSIPYAPLPITNHDLNEAFADYDSPQMQALWETGASFIDNYHLTSKLGQLYHPTQALRTAAKFGIKAGYALNIPTIGQALGFADPISQTIAASGVGGALLLGEKLLDRLNAYQWQLQALQSAPTEIINYPLLLAHQQLRSGGMAVASAALRPFGYALGLISNREIVDPRFQHKRIMKQATVNNVTNAWRGYWAKTFDRPARRFRNEGKNHLAYGFNQAAKKLKEGHSSTNPLALIFGSLIGTAITEALIGWLGQSALGNKIASALMGAVFPAAKSVVSIPTVTAGYYGYQAFGPAGAVVGGTLGMYYQMLLNFTKGTQVIQRSIFLANAETRKELMPRGWDYTVDPNDINLPNDIKRYLNQYTNEIPGSATYGGQSSESLMMMKARWLPQSGILNTIITRPVQFLFKNPIGRLLRIPFRGLLINTVLGIPMGIGPGTTLGNSILLGDYVLQLADQSATLKSVGRGGLWGAAVGAEVANILGLPLGTGLAVGGTIGAVTNGLSLLGDMRTAWVPVESPSFFADVYHPGQSFPVWETHNPANVLGQRFPFLTNRFFGPSLKFFQANPQLLKWAGNLRYLKGAGIGTILGVQLSVLFGVSLPLAMSIGATAGAASHYLWRNYIAERAALGTTALGQAIKWIGNYIVSPITGFLSGSDIVSSISNIITSGITWSNAIQLGLGVAGAASTVAVFAGLGIPVVGWIVVGAGVIAELVARIFFNVSLFEAVWQRIAPFFQGIAGAVGQIMGSLINVFFGFIGAIFAHSPEEMLQYAVMSAFGIATIGTTLLTFVAASGFLSSSSSLEKSLATGILHVSADKVLTQPTTNAAGEITGGAYLITYQYKLPITAQDSSESLPLTNIKITDSYTWPEGLANKDFDVVSFVPGTANVSENGSGVIVSGLNNLESGKSGQVSLGITFNPSLNQLLTELGSTAVCNQVNFKANVASGPHPQTYSNLVCLDQSGQTINPPSGFVAQNLIELLSRCLVQACDPGVTKKDFDPDSCTDKPQTDACVIINAPELRIGGSTLQQIQDDVSAGDNSLGRLRPAAFVAAVEAVNNRDFPILTDPQAYRQSCVGNYAFTDHYSGIQSGDIVVSSQPLGIVTTVNGLSAKLATIDLLGRPLLRQTSLVSIYGYLHYNPGLCP